MYGCTGESGTDGAVVVVRLGGYFKPHTAEPPVWQAAFSSRSSLADVATARATHACAKRRSERTQPYGELELIRNMCATEQAYVRGCVQGCGLVCSFPVSQQLPHHPPAHEQRSLMCSCYCWFSVGPGASACFCARRVCVHKVMQIIEPRGKLSMQTRLAETRGVC